MRLPHFFHFFKYIHLTTLKKTFGRALQRRLAGLSAEMAYNAMATGRSDYANQINNVLAFPAIFRGALDCRASAITTNMYLEAASAIASLIEPGDLHSENIIPSVFDPRVVPAVARAVEQAARQDGVARI